MEILWKLYEGYRYSYLAHNYGYKCIHNNITCPQPSVKTAAHLSDGTRPGEDGVSMWIHSYARQQPGRLSDFFAKN